jgi:Putative zinc-finger
VTAGPDPFEHSDAAYVLGALGHEDRIAYEEHLQDCARCAAAVAELAVLPGLLARLPGLPAPAAEPEQPPDTVLPGLLAQLRRRRSRRRIAGAAAGVAAAAVLVTGAVVVTAQGGAAPEPAGVPVTLAEVGTAPVSAQVRLVGVAWGTQISMICRYDGPAPSGPYDRSATYSLVVVSAEDQSTQQVARWQGLPGRDARVTGSTDLPPDEIAQVQLQDSKGTVLLEGAPPR